MLYFQAKLINAKFDKTNRNVLRFSNREAQQSYFDVASLFNSAPFVNFNAGNLNETTIIYNVQEGENINDILSKNYCIIKDNTPNAPLPYYYYFITNAIQDSGTQVKLWLKLDIFQTYYIDCEFSDCLIRRVHLNRFRNFGTGVVRFRADMESPLLISEEYPEASKLLKSMQQISWKFTNNDIINNWLNTNIAYWVYCFIDKSHSYKTTALNGNDASVEDYQIASYTLTSEGAQVTNNYGVIAFPVYKTNNRIHAHINNTDYDISERAFDIFRGKNNDSSFMYSAKISLVPPPLDISKITIVDNDLIITDSVDLTISAIVPFTNYNLLSINKGASPYFTNNMLFTGIRQNATPIESNPITIPYPISFLKSNIIGQPINNNLNPKLRNMQNIMVRLKSFDGGYFDYDVQKLDSNSLIFIYNETLQPEITKYYCRIKAPTGVYVEDTNKNFLGLVGSTDTTIAISQDQYQAFLANNKNFWLQAGINSIGNLGQALARGAIAGIVANEPNKSIGRGAGTAGISSIIDSSRNLINSTIDAGNMQEAPDALKMAGGNILFSSQVKPITFYVEIHSALDSVLNNRNDFNLMYGYILNRIDNIKNYDNIRKYYNYIEADIEETSGIPISNRVHDEFAEAFRRGVRFWNVDTFKYLPLENYENWLEED